MTMLDAAGEDEKEITMLAISALRNKYSPEDQIRIRDYIKKAIKEPKDSWEKAASGVVEDWTTEMNDGLLSIFRNANVRTSPRVSKEMEKAGAK
jgi:hypothetical protein